MTKEEKRIKELEAQLFNLEVHSERLDDNYNKVFVWISDRLLNKTTVECYDLYVKWLKNRSEQ